MFVTWTQKTQLKRLPMAAAAVCHQVGEQGFAHISYLSIPGSTRELANPEVDS